MNLRDFDVFLHKMIHCGHNNTLICSKLIHTIIEYYLVTSLKGDRRTLFSFFYIDKNVTAHLYDPFSREDARRVRVDARCFKKIVIYIQNYF